MYFFALQPHIMAMERSMVIVLTLALLLPSWPLNATICHFWQSAGAVGTAHLCCISTPQDMFNVWLDLHQLLLHRQTCQNEDKWIWIADTSGARVKWPVLLQTYCIYFQVQTLPQLSFSRSDEVRKDDWCTCRCHHCSSTPLSLLLSRVFHASCPIHSTDGDTTDQFCSQNCLKWDQAKTITTKNQYKTNI